MEALLHSYTVVSTIIGEKTSVQKYIYLYIYSWRPPLRYCKPMTPILCIRQERLLDFELFEGDDFSWRASEDWLNDWRSEVVRSSSMLQRVNASFNRLVSHTT